MGKIAFMFSGQGAQYAGMGKSFFESSPAVKELFESAEKYREGTLKQCFEGDAETLKRTQNTQPCLYLADLAAAMALSELGVTPQAAAGFSLGEIPALAFAGAFSYLDGFKLACGRGEVMGKANDSVKSSMLAVLKLDNETVEKLCEKYEHVYPVNYNSPGQLVVSGLSEELEQFKADVTQARGKCMALPVGGAFHSPFMDGAAKQFGEILKNAKLKRPVLTVYSDAAAKPYGEDVRALLETQINHPVRWSDIITALVADGFDTFIETGAGNTLQKLAKRIAPEANAYSVSDYESARALAEELKNA